MRLKASFLTCLLSVSFCVPAFSAVRAEDARREIIVKFKQGVSEDAIRRICAAQRASVLYTSPFGGFKRINLSRSVSADRVISELRKNPSVQYAVPNSIAHAHFVPDDPLYTPYQWNFDDQAPGGNPYGGANGGGINLEPAWEISTGAGVVVAVLDTGVAYEDRGRYRKAPDLGDTNFVAGWDFANNDAYPNDDESHGTHVTGTIAQSTDNGLGVAGIAFDCSIMPVKVLDKNGEGTLQQVVDGIYYAVDHGAAVINMSLGWPPGYDPGEPLKDALDYAYDNGVTVVCSSGNDEADTVSYPAAYWSTIAVGATRYDEMRAYYSNYGPSLDVVAPGGQMYILIDEEWHLLDQNGDGYGDGILQNTFNPLTQNPRDFGYWFFNGTSMAAPHVSGVAALLIARGVATPDDVRYALQSTAEDKGAPGWDSEYGWGIVDAYAALNADLTFVLSDAELMSLDDTYVGPYPGFADLVAKTDVPGPGVEYDVTLYGAWGIDIWIGGPPPQANLGAYSHYSLSFTNTTINDTFSANLYLKTGPGQTYYGSGWVTLGPGMSWTLSLDLGGVGNLDDVREIGLGLSAWKGSAWGYADAILVEVKGQTPTQ